VIRPRAEAVAVIVPAHDEADRIEACIQSIALAATHPKVAARAVEVTVVLDGCHDATGERAETAIMQAQAIHGAGFSGRVSEVAYASVGRARAHGMHVALGALAGVDTDGIWLATTDADSVVPADWLVHQLHMRSRGYDAIAGTVRVIAWDGQPAALARLHAEHYQRGGGLNFGHPHVHGANLSFSASAYLKAGGFSPAVTGEDHALWYELRAAGVTSLSSPLAAVTTSARREGRAPDGFAGFLKALKPAA
jgi:cellulose synthase/poly-beta-1,6-N-acetylglucosamine synthase-like glycosyltransferase